MRIASVSDLPMKLWGRRAANPPQVANLPHIYADGAVRDRIGEA